MTIETIKISLPEGEIAAGGTATLPYPSGKVAVNYLTTGAKLTDNAGNVYDVTVSLGAGGITVTNPTGRKLKQADVGYLQLTVDDVGAADSELNDVVYATRDASGNVVGLSAGGEIDLAALALPGYTRTLSGTVIYADGNTLIDLGQPITGATMTISPQTGAAGIDYTADAVPHVSTGEWVAVYGGNVDVNAQITFDGAITAIRIRPIASGADIDYTITAPGSEYYATDSITFAGGNEMVTLPTPMAGVSVFVLPSAGAIGVDYTADATPHVSTGAWTEVYGGNISTNDSIQISASITGLRFRPTATGAAADYIVRR